MRKLFAADSDVVVPCGHDPAHIAAPELAKRMAHKHTAVKQRATWLTWAIRVSDLAEKISQETPGAGDGQGTFQSTYQTTYQGTYQDLAVF